MAYQPDIGKVSDHVIDNLIGIARYRFRGTEFPMSVLRDYLHEDLGYPRGFAKGVTGAIINRAFQHGMLYKKMEGESSWYGFHD